MRYGLWVSITEIKKWNCAIWIYCYSVPFGFEGFCKQLLEQFHSGQFLISRSRFTIEDINLLLLISHDILRAKCAYVFAYVSTILKDSLKTISTETIGQTSEFHVPNKSNRSERVFQNSTKVQRFSIFVNRFTAVCWNQFLLVDCFECYVQFPCVW